jgi:acylphosphatase
MKRLHATITGHVQGVYFRDFVRMQARRLRLTGWVRNNPDGSVEVVAEGEDVALSHLKLLLEKGPAGARVEEVEATNTAPTGEFSDFTIRH